MVTGWRGPRHTGDLEPEADLLARIDASAAPGSLRAARHRPGTDAPHGALDHYRRNRRAKGL